MKIKEGSTWPIGQPTGLKIQWSRVQDPLWPLAGFVLSHPEFKSLPTLACK